jgi:CxxC-x17-CxxC domain-containing protein
VSFVDKTLTCADCGATFLFSAGEQEFFATKGFQNEPKRCPDCRRIRRSRMNALSSGPRQMYPVICAQCGVETEVPFQPTGIKPVYCRACFDKLRESGLEGQPTAEPAPLESALASSGASSLVEPTPTDSAPSVSVGDSV